jgi:hypothetical protein
MMITFALSVLSLAVFLFTAFAALVAVNFYIWGTLGGWGWHD